MAFASLKDFEQDKTVAPIPTLFSEIHGTRIPRSSYRRYCKLDGLGMTIKYRFDAMNM